jgi:hypothetical protein
MNEREIGTRYACETQAPATVGVTVKARLFGGGKETVD